MTQILSTCPTFPTKHHITIFSYQPNTHILLFYVHTHIYPHYSLTVSPKTKCHSSSPLLSSIILIFPCVVSLSISTSFHSLTYHHDYVPFTLNLGGTVTHLPPATTLQTNTINTSHKETPSSQNFKWFIPGLWRSDVGTSGSLVGVGCRSSWGGSSLYVWGSCGYAAAPGPEEGNNEVTNKKISLGLTSVLNESKHTRILCNVFTYVIILIILRWGSCTSVVKINFDWAKNDLKPRCKMQYSTYLYVPITDLTDDEGRLAPRVSPSQHWGTPLPPTSLAGLLATPRERRDGDTGLLRGLGVTSFTLYTLRRRPREGCRRLLMSH